MTARDDVTRAAERLTQQDRSPFTPSRLIAEARNGGSTYPDRTLQTHIVNTMCVNVPNHGPARPGELVRVGRGSYQLADAAADQPSPRGAPADAVPEDVPASAAAFPTWFWEGEVQSAVVHHLTKEGWRIRRAADSASRERGSSIEAERAGVRILVEVKGYPSDTSVRGHRAGQPRTATSNPTQARAHFGGALLTTVLMRTEHPNKRIVMAFPAMETYRALARRCLPTLQRVDIEVWFVNGAGAIEALTPG